MKPLSVNGIVEGIEEVRVYLDAHGYDASQMGIPSETATIVDENGSDYDASTTLQRSTIAFVIWLSRSGSRRHFSSLRPATTRIASASVLVDFFRLTRLLRNLQSPDLECTLVNPSRRIFNH